MMLIGTLLPMLVLHRACACACTHAPDKYKYKSQVNITLRAPHTERPRETDWTERETRAAETATRERDRRAPRARTRLISSRPTPYSYHIRAPSRRGSRLPDCRRRAVCGVLRTRGGRGAARGGAGLRALRPPGAHTGRVTTQRGVSVCACRTRPGETSVCGLTHLTSHRAAHSISILDDANRNAQPFLSPFTPTHRLAPTSSSDSVLLACGPHSRWIPPRRGTSTR